MALTSLDTEKLLNYPSLIYLYRQNNEESEHDEIKKQALLEALFDTKLWDMPYVRENPFLYLTPNTQDFEGMEGRLMLNNFKNTFLKAFNQYSQAVAKWDKKVNE